jgi:hypothetical protein
MCDSPAIGQCQVCWRFYCHLHGELICDTCKAKSPDWQASPFQDLSHQVLVSGPDAPPPTAEQLQEMMSQLGIVRKTTLRRVIPVAQTQTMGDTQVTLASLDVYDECFVTRFLIRRLESQEKDPVQGMFHGMPSMDWHITDNTGRMYRTSFDGGGGGSDDYHYEMTVSPGLEKDVNRLDFVINEIEWNTMPFMPQAFSRKKIEPGPWRFEVPVI